MHSQSAQEISVSLIYFIYNLLMNPDVYNPGGMADYRWLLGSPTQSLSDIEFR